MPALARKNSLGGAVAYFRYCVPTRRKIDERIPYTLERQHSATDCAKLKVDMPFVRDAIQSIYGTWYPGDQYSKPENEARSKIGHLHGVKVSQPRGRSELQLPKLI